MKKTYCYTHPSGKTKIINKGFCWPACLFGPLWALIKGIWNALFFLVALTIVLNLFISYGEEQKSLWLILLGGFLTISIMYGCGKIGNAWHMLALEKKGYICLATDSQSDASGNNEPDAI